MEQQEPGVTAKSGDEALPSLQLAYEAAKYVQSIQLDQIDKLDTKAGLVLGAGGIILTVLAGNGALVATSALFIYAVLLFGAGFLITASIALTVWALDVRRWNIVPELKQIRNVYIKQAEKDVKLTVLDTLIEAIDTNGQLIDSKANLVKWGLRLLGMGAILFGVGFLYNVAIGSPIWGVVECLMKIGSQC